MEALITAMGTYVPERVVDNHELEKMVETNDEWIRSRTGIVERRYAADGEYTSSLCRKAAADLAARSGKQLEDVDFILVSTVSPDQPMPSMAALLQHQLGIPNAGALDISAACAGFSYAILLAKSLIESGLYHKILLFGAETLTKVTDFSDRTTCILFGDGAGAALIEAAPDGNIGACIAGADGSGGQDLYLSNANTIINGEPVIPSGKIVQNGRRVFKWAVSQMAEQFNLLLEKNKMSIEQLDWFVPHSANLRIIEAICRQVGLPPEKALESVSLYGNTSSASIPLALNKGLQDGKVKAGDRLMLLGFGGGLSYAGTIIEWRA